MPPKLSHKGGGNQEGPGSVHRRLENPRQPEENARLRRVG